MSTRSKLRRHRHLLNGCAPPARRPRRNPGERGSQPEDISHVWHYFLQVTPGFKAYRDHRDHVLGYMGGKLAARFDHDVLYQSIVSMIPLCESRTGATEYAPYEEGYTHDLALILGRLFLDYVYHPIRHDFDLEAGPKSTYR